MLITELLDRLKKLAKKEITPDVSEHLSIIKTLCRRKYHDRSFYGHTALNRQMLLDADIAEHLTPEVLQCLFTHDQPVLIHRTGGSIPLSEAIDYAFRDKLPIIKYLPNNEADYNANKYEEQLKKYEHNTKRIIHNIELACQESCTEDADSLLERMMQSVDLKTQFLQIVQTIQSIKAEGKSDVLLSVAGYTLEEMRNQVFWGFCSIEKDLAPQALDTLDLFCEGFLRNKNLLFDGNVIHLFYDRAHIESALEQNTKIPIGEDEYTFEQIFSAMVDKLVAHPEDYPEARCQFTLRFDLVVADLNKRFPEIWHRSQQAVRFGSTQSFFASSSKIIPSVLDAPIQVSTSSSIK